MSARGGVSPVLGYIALAAAGVAVPLLTNDSYYLDVATTMMISLVLAMSLRFEMSTGQLNMAHVSFMGIGGYVSALLVMNGGVSFWVSIWLAGIAAAMAALPVGRIALRLAGPYYFLVTFAFLEVVRLVFNNFFVESLGGPSGLVKIPPPDPISIVGLSLTFTDKRSIYCVALGVFLLVAAVLVRLEYSRFGLVANAIRQSDVLSNSLGVNVMRYKLLTFVLGSFCAGLAGALYAHSRRVLHSSDFGLEPIVLLVIYVVLGGVGSVWGPILGTVVLGITAELLREVHQYETLLYGSVLVLAMLFFPDGLLSLPQRLVACVRLRGAVPGAAPVREDRAS